LRKKRRIKIFVPDLIYLPKINQFSSEVKDFCDNFGIIQMTNKWVKTGRAGSSARRTLGFATDGAHGVTRPTQKAC
jgi:hypothetical protein